mmetsp:Transcript_21662/g.60123  ORF Transcript_21662/g.60123 Transcript_21662/m.60123 type:complete len:421 (-) Transcript_21662:1850-3112(-)
MMVHNLSLIFFFHHLLRGSSALSLKGSKVKPFFGFQSQQPASQPAIPSVVGGGDVASSSSSSRRLNQEDVLSIAQQSLEECMEAATGEGAERNDPGRLRRIEISLERLYDACRRFEQDEATPDEIAETKEAIRVLARPFTAVGPFGKEISTWPRGPGSSTAMRYVYEGVHLLSCNTLLAHYSEWYMRTRDLSLAVLSRKDKLRALLQKELIHQSSPISNNSKSKTKIINNDDDESIRILDLANGPIQSLKEVIQDGIVPANVLQQVDYRGYDTDSIIQADNQVWMEESDFTGQFAFHVEDALRAPFKGDARKDYNNIVYSTGFFDYLNDSLLKTLWKKCFASLKPGGVLLISLKDSAKYHAQMYHYMVKWDQFFQRNEEHFLQLLDEANLQPESCIRDSTGIILFYVVRKKPDAAAAVVE